MDKEDESKRTEAKLKQELTEAKIEIHNLKYAQKNLNNENIQSLEQIQKIKQEIDDLNQKHSEAETKAKYELKNLTQTKESIDEENCQMRLQIENLETEQNNFFDHLKLPQNDQRNFTSVKKAIENILQSNNEFLSKQISEANVKAKLEEEKLQKDIDHLKSKIKNLETEQNKFFDHLNLPQNDQRNFTSVKKAIENILHSNNEFFTKQISEANDKAKLEEEKLQQEIDNLKLKMNEEIQKVCDLNQKLTEKNCQVNDLKQSNGSGNQSNTTQQIEDLNEKVMQTNQKLAIQKEKCETLENQMQKLMDILKIAPNNRNFYTLRRELEVLKQQYSIEKERADHLATIDV